MWETTFYDKQPFFFENKVIHVASLPYHLYHSHTIFSEKYSLRVWEYFHSSLCKVWPKDISPIFVHTKYLCIELISLQFQLLTSTYSSSQRLNTKYSIKVSKPTLYKVPLFVFFCLNILEDPFAINFSYHRIFIS